MITGERIAMEVEHKVEEFSVSNMDTEITKVNSDKPGYDSGLGESPPLGPSPPTTLPLNINIKPKPRRRRGTSTTTHTFQENYERTEKVLGSGAFSSVEMCKCIRTGKEFAVKIIDKNNWYTRSRVLQEVEILYRGNGHPNIIQLENYYEGDDQFYLVFEMMRGGALIDHIESHKTFTEREAAKVLKCVALALQHLHNQGIAHRDLKFENLLCPDGNDFTNVKICDFDLGGQKLDVPYTKTPLMDSPVGSAEFMAPEVVSLFEGQLSVYDKSCDMWSLGILLYIMIFGRPPFTGRCGLTCGWNEGMECGKCQELLFQSITSGIVTFDNDKYVSQGVKNLISSLLMKNAKLRLTATEVLNHPWVQEEGNDNILFTPQQLRRNKSSASHLGSFSTQINQHYRRINSNIENFVDSNLGDPLANFRQHDFDVVSGTDTSEADDLVTPVQQFTDIHAEFYISSGDDTE